MWVFVDANRTESTKKDGTGKSRYAGTVMQACDSYTRCTNPYVSALSGVWQMPACFREANAAALGYGVGKWSKWCCF
jgi:hypothetical protein